MPSESTTSTTLHGTTVTAADPEALRHAIELAFNYRGDVSIIRRSSPDAVEGYVFDRREKPSPSESIMRIIPKDGSPRLTIAYSDVAELRFTGKDTAEGRSFETWMRKYARKKLRGEAANIESEPLDES